MLASSSYDRRIVIERCTRTTSASGSGAVSESWSTYATRWAHFEPTDAGRESEDEGQKRVSWMGGKFTFRNDSAISVTVKDRVLVTIAGQSRTYEILGVQQAQRNNDIELQCRARGE